MTIQTILFLFAALPPLALIAEVLRRRGANELVTLHLAMFWLEMFAYGTLSIAIGEHREYRTALLLFVALLLGVYVVATLVLEVSLRKYSGLSTYVMEALRTEYIGALLLCWLAIKAALYASYGAAVFGATDERELAGVPIAWVDLDLFMIWPAWGAYFAYLVHQRMRSRLDWVLPIWLLFLAIEILVDNSGGGKRVLIVSALVFLVIGGNHKPMTSRVVMVALSTLCITGLAANYYEGMRSSFSELVSTSKENRFTDWTAFFANLSSPAERAGAAEEIQNRQTPLDLLYEITRAEFDGQFTHGELTAQVVNNLLPNGLFEKHFEDEDEILSSAFDFPDDDYATSTLAIVQAETFVFGYALTPALYVTVFYLYLAVMMRLCRAASHGEEINFSMIQSLMVATLMGGAITSATAIEGSPTEILAIGRNVAAIVITAYCLEFLFTFNRTRRRLSRGLRPTRHDNRLGNGASVGLRAVEGSQLN